MVHSGIAEGGHYYSFSQDRQTDKWYQFDDQYVSDFKESEIPDETFGGEERWGGYGNFWGGVHMKSRNAYLVFYDRIVDEDWPDSDEEDIEEAYPSEVVTLPDEIKEMITISNKKYWQNKFLFAQEYLNKFAEIFTYWNTSVVIPY